MSPKAYAAMRELLAAHWADRLAAIDRARDEFLATLGHFDSFEDPVPEFEIARQRVEEAAMWAKKGLGGEGGSRQ